MENNKSELESLIKNLCIMIFTELESIGGESKSKESINDIIRFNSFTALDYISNAIEKSLNAKTEAKKKPNYQNFVNNESYQKEMQKLENEIRNHIKIEQQMKLYADALEEKNNALESKKKELKKNYSETIESKKEANKELRQKINEISKTIENFKGKNEVPIKEIAQNKGKENFKLKDVDKKLALAELEYEKVSKAILDSELEYAQQKKDNEELKVLLKEFVGMNPEKEQEERLMYKQKYEQKCEEIELLKKKMRFYEGSNGKRNSSRSITPSISKASGMQSQKSIKRISSLEKIKQKGLEKLPLKTDRDVNIEKKRLPMSFTMRR